MTGRFPFGDKKKAPYWGRLVLCALIVLGAAVLSECVFNRMPFPAGGCCVSGGDRTIIFNGNFCDNALKHECASGNDCYPASNFAFATGLTTLVTGLLNNLSFFSASNKWRSQQLIDWRHVFHRRDRLAESKSKFDVPDEGREFSPIHHGINQSRFNPIGLSPLFEKPIIVQNEQVGTFQFGEGSFRNIDRLFGYFPHFFAGEPKGAREYCDGNSSDGTKSGSYPIKSFSDLPERDQGYVVGGAFFVASLVFIAIIYVCRKNT